MRRTAVTSVLVGLVLSGVLVAGCGSGDDDKESGLSVTAFIGRINEIVAALHADGTLERLSEKYFRKDYATKAAEFDLEAIEQDLR